MDLRDLQKSAKEQGWRLDTTTKGHPRFTPPDVTKKPCTFSGTPSDQKAIKNLMTCLKHSGFIWPWRKRGAR